MSNLNILNVTSILGNTDVLPLTTTATTFISNPASSNKTYKINTLIVSNINTTAAAVVAYIYKNNSVQSRLAFNVPVPAGSVLVLISKDTSIYLNENDSIQILASANSYLEATCSYEILS